MYILHLQSRCTETDSEYFLLDQCYALFYVSKFWLVKGGGRGQRGRTSPSPLGKTSDTGTYMLNVKVCKNGYFIGLFGFGYINKTGSIISMMCAILISLLYVYVYTSQ